ncbi:MAG: hypothetical protein ACRD2N_10290 [Vicinamibacterales bacterium]
MPDFDIVFEKLAELTSQDQPEHPDNDHDPKAQELDEINELRRFSAELQEPDPLSFTTT